MSADATVAIVGAGPVGLAAAAALHRGGIDCAVLEARPGGQTSADPRVLALSHGSRQILEWLGVWPALRTTPILAIHVSQRGHFGRTLLSASDAGVPALGYVVEAARLAQELERSTAASGIRILHAAKVEGASAEGGEVALAIAGGRSLRARLALFAEGTIGGERALTRDYGQRALVASARIDGPHRALAYERFTEQGPIALLPHGEQLAVVWVCATETARGLEELDAEVLRDALQRSFGDRVRFTGVRLHGSFPLALRLRRDTVRERCVWLGNSAQTLHPVAGQGFNLALRDVWQLAEIVREHADDPGAATVLRRHAQARRVDRLATAGFTDGLIRLFCEAGAPLAPARAAGLLLLDLAPALRAALARRMIFGARAWP